MLRRLLQLGLLLAALCCPLLAQAAGGDITLFNFNDTEDGQTLSVKLQILLVMTLLGFLPAMLMMMTCFTPVSYTHLDVYKRQAGS